MKNSLGKRLMFAFALTALFSMGSCKDNDVREGEMVGPDGIEAEPMGTTATDASADTTSMMEEDSIMDVPAP